VTERADPQPDDSPISYLRASDHFRFGGKPPGALSATGLGHQGILWFLGGSEDGQNPFCNYQWFFFLTMPTAAAQAQEPERVLSLNSIRLAGYHDAHRLLPAFPAILDALSG